MTLRSLIFLAVLICVVSSNRTKPPRKPLVYWEFHGSPEEFMIDINKLRRDYAKQYNVSNMHELIWDKDLEEILLSIDVTKTFYDITGPWVLCSTIGYKFVIEDVEKEFGYYQGLDEKGRKEIMDDGWSGTRIVDLLAPLQTVIACEAVAVEDKTYSDINCLLGFQSQIEVFDIDPPSMGIPGSACMEGYENDDGLCVYKKTMDISFLGTREIFMTKLNELRKKLAGENGMENMHELSWSKGLVNLAEDLEWDDSNPPNGDEFISFRIENYRNLPEILERLSNEYLEKGDDEKNAFLEGTNSTKWILSLISPFQQFLGCSKRYSLQDTHILCLIGPQLELKLKSDSSSECALGFEKSENSSFCVFKKSDSVEVTYLGHPEEFVENLNVLRKKYSKKYNVPDMNQLIWTPELSKTAEFLTWPNTSKWEDLNEKYRYTVIQSYRNPIEFLEELNEEDYEHSENHRDLEFMVPGQKMIGCSIKMENSKNFILCLMGPEGNYKLWDQKSEKSPGSECSNGFKNEDGLCIPTEKIDYFGSKIDFLDWINDLRLQYADRYQIKNMHKLIWSEELTEISNFLEFSNSRQNYSNYRTVILPSYSEFSKILEFELIDFVRMSRENRQEFLENSQNNFNLKSKEFLNPIQQFVGCSPKFLEQKSIIFCLIGNHGLFLNWDFLEISKCSKGFEKDENGICAPRELEKISFFGNFEYFLEDLNDLRRDLAWKFNISNMNFLIASSELTEISENFDFSNAANGSWRVAEIPNFEGMIPKILEKLGNWNQTENPGFLELLNPNQKFLGCSIRKQRNLESPIFCVIGNESKFELWNSHSNEIPGSNCSSGYEDFYGLCAPEGTKDSQMTSTTSSSTSIPPTEEIQMTTTTPETSPPTTPPTTQKPQKETKIPENSGESKKTRIPEKQISEVSENSENPIESSNSSICGPIFSLLVFFICIFWE
ncbi:hypothetical protein B9Z55_007956 [Caenorhabditis nigoni]|uniref:C-type lectin domain-containing protein n=1 Tax=Caenorhabditis nigoni TaxID=1611254 RepID=A0A2G5VC29_9PELO|nr:hypothetical protein B9Z55_007956 [Caenorhabditis nigoni]